MHKNFGWKSFTRANDYNTFLRIYTFDVLVQKLLNAQKSIIVILNNFKYISTFFIFIFAL